MEVILYVLKCSGYKEQAAQMFEFQSLDKAFLQRKQGEYLSNGWQCEFTEVALKSYKKPELYPTHECGYIHDPSKPCPKAMQP